MSKRRTHSPEFKARVAMEAISGRKTIQEIAADHAIHPIQVSQWKRQLRFFFEPLQLHLQPADLLEQLSFLGLPFLLVLALPAAAEQLAGAIEQLL